MQERCFGPEPWALSMTVARSYSRGERDVDDLVREQAGTFVAQSLERQWPNEAPAKAPRETGPFRKPTENRM